MMSDPIRLHLSPTDLNKLMEFDHVIEVHEDGSVSEPRNVWAPGLYDERLDQLGDDWSFFTTGYTRKDHYAGPIMHNSELIGGALAEDILSEPGQYAAVVAYWSPELDGVKIDRDGDDDFHEPDMEGWAIVRRDTPTADTASANG